MKLIQSLKCSILKRSKNVYRNVNPIKPIVLFFTPRKIQKNFGFLAFSGGIEKEH